MQQIVRALLLMVLVSFVLGSGLACATDKSYVISYSEDTYTHKLARDLVRNAYQRAGLKVEFLVLPLSRSLVDANKGTVDGDVGRFSLIEENYPDLRRVDVKLMDLNAAVYTIDPSIGTYETSTLSDYRVGYVRGVRWAEAEMAGREAATAHNYHALFEMLLQGRIDLVLAVEEEADHALNALGPRAERVKQLRPFVFSAPLYHYVNSKNAAIIPRLEQAIREINTEGVLVFYTGVQSPIFEILQMRLEEAFGRIGKSCEVRSTGSSQRALLMANEKGDGDAYRNDKIKQLNPDLTANLLIIPESIDEVEFFVYTRGKQLAMTDWRSLDGLNNGLRNGVKILEKNIPNRQVRLPDTDRLLMMLAVDRLDTVTEHGPVADFKIRQLKLQEITKMTPPLASFPGYSYIHKKHKQLIPAIAASLSEMKRDGRFMQIEKDVFKKLLPGLTAGTP